MQKFPNFYIHFMWPAAAPAARPWPRLSMFIYRSKHAYRFRKMRCIYCPCQSEPAQLLPLPTRQLLLLPAHQLLPLANSQLLSLPATQLLQSGKKLLKEAQEGFKACQKAFKLL